MIGSDLEQLENIAISHLASHDSTCCPDAKVLLLGTLLVHRDVASALATVPHIVPWAPTRWPSTWCEVQRAGAGDCGVHAVLASEVLSHFGVEHVRGRAVIVPDAEVSHHWRARWAQAGVGAPWIASTSVHHEVLRVGTRWWDPTDTCWIDGVGSRVQDGRIAALREEGGEWTVAR